MQRAGTPSGSERRSGGRSNRGTFDGCSSQPYYRRGVGPLLLLRRHAGLLASVALVVTWSSGFIGAELGSRAGAAPLTLLGWRFTLLAALMVLVAMVRCVPLPRGRPGGVRLYSGRSARWATWSSSSKGSPAV